VFVLGAGASMPYGFPSGAQLRTAICQAAGEGDWLLEYLQRKVGIEPNEVKDFAKVFLRSGVASIDSFLAKRPEFIDIGRFAIAAHLAAKENLSTLESEGIEDNWYRTLWNVLIDGADSVAALRQNRVKFVTFNYDRSLECYLHHAAKNTFGRSDEETLNAWSQLTILHAYGKLGEFHFASGDGRRQYIPDVNAVGLQTAAAGIQLIPEHRRSTFEDARELFAKAEKICFLGFGFDPLNVERLGLESVLSWKKGRGEPIPEIYASTFQKTQAEKVKIHTALCPSVAWKTFDERNVMTLRESGIL